MLLTHLGRQRWRLILQTLHRFTYVRAHSSTLPSLHLRHSSFYNFPLLHLSISPFSNPFFACPTSQALLILKLLSLHLCHSSFSNPFRRFTYVTAHSPTLPSLYLRHSSFYNFPLLHLRQSSFSNPSFASPTSWALHLIHLASSPWWMQGQWNCLNILKQILWNKTYFQLQVDILRLNLQ